MHRQYDYENYVWMVQQPKVCSFCPAWLTLWVGDWHVCACVQEVRPSLFALRAFNIELAQIGSQVKEPGSASTPIIQLRFRWWQDAVAALYQGQAPKNPVMVALAAVLLVRPLNRYHFRRIIDTREQVRGGEG